MEYFAVAAALFFPLMSIAFIFLASILKDKHGGFLQILFLALALLQPIIGASVMMVSSNTNSTVTNVYQYNLNYTTVNVSKCSVGTVTGWTTCSGGGTFSNDVYNESNLLLYNITTTYQYNNASDVNSPAFNLFGTAFAGYNWLFILFMFYIALLLLIWILTRFVKGKEAPKV